MRLILLICTASTAVCTLISRSQGCLTDGGADSFHTVFGGIRRKVEGYEELIDKFISPNFEFISDSLAFLTAGTLNKTNAHSAQEYLSSCDTITTYSEFIVGDVPIRAFNLYFVDIATAKIAKIYAEINSAAARYATCKLNSTACPTQVKYNIGNDGPAYGVSGCQARL
ncbi:hypothetical protein BST61_g6478 [Cercospora zeina]